MPKRVKVSSTAPAGPVSDAAMREEMLRHQAETIVRGAIGKTAGFQREVTRVVGELKALERSAARRVGKA